MNDIVQKLWSRKLLVALAGVIYLVLQGDLEGAKQIVFVYLSAQGLSDAAARYNPRK